MVGITSSDCCISFSSVIANIHVEITHTHTHTQSGQFYNPNSKTGIILPDFPKISDLNFTKPFPVEKVSHPYALRLSSAFPTVVGCVSNMCTIYHSISGLQVCESQYNQCNPSTVKTIPTNVTGYSCSSKMDMNIGTEY